MYWPVGYLLRSLSNSSRKKLKRDCLKVSPDFRDEAGNTFVLVVNANLQISLCENGLHDHLGSASGRIKVQLMADTLGWLGRSCHPSLDMFLLK